MKRKKQLYKKHDKTTINKYGLDGYSAIGRACKNNDQKTVKYLLKKFPEIDLSKGKQNFLKEEWELTVLDIAKSMQNHKMIKLLAKHNPNILLHSEESIPRMNISGLTDIWLSQGFGAFIEKTNAIAESYQKGVSRALKSAIKEHKEEKIISSLSKSVSVTRHDLPEHSELHTAIKANNIVAVKTIYIHVPELIDKANSLNQTPLHVAARLAKNEILEFLIDKSNNLYPLDVKGFTPLNYALKEGHVNTAALLIKHGLISSKYRDNHEEALVSENSRKIEKLKKYIVTLEQVQKIVASYIAEIDHSADLAEESPATLSPLDPLDIDVPIVALGCDQVVE